MISVRSRLVLQTRQPQCPCLSGNPFRRWSFAATAGLLVIAAIIGAGQAPLAQHPFGSMLYLLLTGVCAMTAAVNRVICFNLAEQQVYGYVSVFGCKLGRYSFPLQEVRSVQLVGLRMIAESAKPRPGALNAGLRGHVERRMRYYRLALQLHDTTHRLEDGSDGVELQQLGRSLALCIGKPFSFEES
ncbi:hypothetical protein [Spirochaeta africana]|uniref:Uncharacterized protein n=1 Tax=Spirochaeta africana (strain ATCC 700263 / DSM 8902 / Z-7692) TaxID=889378 RepID=H9UMK8_SPIAZ|nr:hypothetical protein [Spirochaeta africana]AFG38751.1 hypothetical protein Spiaf_2727 [Spirochaeta africana DSM 8902]